MTEPEMIEVLDFLGKNPVGVISTIHKDIGTPESALVAFAETPTFEIIFQTLTTSRKYLNLKKSPCISFVTGWKIDKPNQITFQYEGSARELDINDAEYKKYRSAFEQKKTPCTVEFLDNPNSRLFVVSPVWFSYSNYTQENSRIIEQSF
jgi:pyridoxine/pyridoxamine 5'-phosphate oxidase